MCVALIYLPRMLPLYVPGAGVTEKLVKLSSNPVDQVCKFDVGHLRNKVERSREVVSMWPLGRGTVI